MTRQRYNATESWNRILRIAEGDPVPTDVPGTVTGEVLSLDEVWSDYAELMANSLPNQTPQIPASMFATVDEANAGVATNKVLSPASHSWAHEYGGIFVSTGTNSSPVNSLLADTWTKVTGTFKGAMLDSGAEIYCHAAQDRVVVNEVGTYLVSYHVDLLNMGDATVLKGLAYAGTTQQRATQSYRSFGVSGTSDASGALIGFGMVAVAASGTAVSLYLNAVAATKYQVAAAQLTVQKMVG
jgi:hypothetical protein